MSATQWKSGAAAWLGWLFDGLDLHLYTLVAVTVVAGLLGTEQSDPQVVYYSGWIQAAFLVGWALGGSFFGIVGDRIGRSRTLMLTILTYALFTGVSYLAQTWWQLLIFRFVAALGIGGEWAVGASLLSETWPKTWRVWVAAVLQTAVNVGIMLASLAVFLMSDFHPQSVFLVGVLPALLVVWIRQAVPEPEEWSQARALHQQSPPKSLDLFRGSMRRTTLLTLTVCSFALTAHWAFMFWYAQHLRSLAEFNTWTSAQRSVVISEATMLLMVTSVLGNFLAAFIARYLGYRRAIAVLCIGYFLTLFVTYVYAQSYSELRYGFIAIGLCQGVFALFTMYLPALFPVLQRTTGAGFCFNFGRIVAAAGTVVFGLFTQVTDYRMALLAAATLFLPAGLISLILPEPVDEAPAIASTPTPLRLEVPSLARQVEGGCNR